jgi:hypothetical protein
LDEQRREFLNYVSEDHTVIKGTTGGTCSWSAPLQTAVEGKSHTEITFLLVHRMACSALLR